MTNMNKNIEAMNKTELKQLAKDLIPEICRLKNEVSELKKKVELLQKLV